MRAAGLRKRPGEAALVWALPEADCFFTNVTHGIQTSKEKQMEDLWAPVEAQGGTSKAKSRTLPATGVGSLHKGQQIHIFYRHGTVS